MVILPSNVFVYSKWSHLRGVPLVEMHIMSQTTLPPLPASLCRPSNLLQPDEEEVIVKVKGKLFLTHLFEVVDHVEIS